MSDLKQLQAKWNDIVQDYAANVTHIYGREIFHQCFDVVFHSALTFTFKGEPVQRGWVEGLLVSDTRCGKSKVASSLCKHFQVSPPVNCERASMPGVLGGILQEGGGRQSVIWGAIPRQDKRAVVLEELTGLKTEDISQMSDCRSSGIASIVKIINERTMARTRKLGLSNPRSDRNRKMNTYAFGVVTIPEIIGRAEDIARFDFATGAQAEEVPDDVLNAEDRPQHPHVYTSEAAHALLFWCWTRKPDQIKWHPGVENLCLKVATTMSQRYNSQIPLVEPGEQRLRVARVAVALAGRFHSTTNGEDVMVMPEHVELADWFFKQCYDRPAFGYDAYSKERIKVETCTGDDYVQIIQSLGTYVNFPVLMQALASAESLDRLPVMHYQDQAKILSLLIELGLAETTATGVIKTRKFNIFNSMWKTKGGK